MRCVISCRQNLTRLINISILIPFLIGPTLILPTPHPVLIRFLVQNPRGDTIIITYIRDIKAFISGAPPQLFFFYYREYLSAVYLWPSAQGRGASTESRSWPDLTRNCTLDYSGTDLQGPESETASAWFLSEAGRCELKNSHSFPVLRKRTKYLCS